MQPQIQNTFKKVVFAEPPMLNLISPTLRDSPFINLYKLPSPQKSSTHDLIKNNASPRVNLPNNSIKFCSIKDYEVFNNNGYETNSKNQNPNLETLVNQSLMSQINDNITGYKSEKLGQLEAEISSLLRVIKEKQEDINLMKGDINALTIALKEKDILARDSKQLVMSMNTLLIENRRLNELTVEKITELSQTRETLERITNENEMLRRKNQELIDEMNRLQLGIEGSKEYIDRNSKSFIKDVENLKKTNNELIIELQKQQRNSQINDSSFLRQELEQYKTKVDCLMGENIRLNELNNEKANLDENLLQLIERSEDLIKENERLNILIKEQTLENNSWRNKLYESDQKILLLTEQNNQRIREFSSENEDFKQRNQKLLEEINQLVFLIKEKDKFDEENNNLRKILEKKELVISEMKIECDSKENIEKEMKDCKKKMENLVLENIKLNTFVEEKLKEYNALEDLNGKIEILISENEKLNNLILESQTQIEYWKTRFFAVSSK